MPTTPDSESFATFDTLCHTAEHDLKTAHESLMHLWHHATDLGPFAGMVIEPVVSETAASCRRIEQLRKIAEAFARARVREGL